MNDPVIVSIGLHWLAVIVYSIAAVINVFGVIFEKKSFERISYLIIAVGLLMHGIAILYWWYITGHGPYMVKYEVLSSSAWVSLALFLVFMKIFPKIKSLSIFIFPSTFLLIALGLFFNPEIKKVPPTFNSIWLVLHVSFYKIALGTLLIALAFSFFFILQERSNIRWLARLPAKNIVDIYAYRFAGFGFTFWGIAMLSGSIWAYQSWGRFWAWDPIESWSLITWIFFGLYLHLRRFFGWAGEKASYLYIFCFLLSVFSLFFVPLFDTTIHGEYFS
jgi:cytochrome c-type biogenesis protein CcsB